MGEMRLKISRLTNGSFVAFLLESGFENTNDSEVRHKDVSKEYDDQGALYYVIAVVFIYGFSIILMIASSMKKSRRDSGMGRYMKDLDKVRRLERRQEKFKMRLVMSRKGISRILGSDSAEVNQNASSNASLSSNPLQPLPTTTVAIADSTTGATSAIQYFSGQTALFSSSELPTASAMTLKSSIDDAIPKTNPELGPLSDAILIGSVSPMHDSRPQANNVVASETRCLLNNRLEASGEKLIADDRLTLEPLIEEREEHYFV